MLENAHYMALNTIVDTTSLETLELDEEVETESDSDDAEAEDELADEDGEEGETV